MSIELLLDLALGAIVGAALGALHMLWLWRASTRLGADGSGALALVEARPAQETKEVTNSFRITLSSSELLVLWQRKRRPQALKTLISCRCDHWTPGGFAADTSGCCAPLQRYAQGAWGYA